ncbi:MAG: acetylxylan esterase [Bacteroidaceae bacterium]|nr:acetylxylan esterase [Bacteroidaceae bacterium]
MKKTLVLALSLGLCSLGSTANAQDSKYFAPATEKAMAPDDEGFIRRWLLLEPFNKPNRSNTPFVDSYIRDAFATNVPNPSPVTTLPSDGQKVKIGDQELTWHALDSKLFNAKLYRFATERELTKYGVVFWATTVINCTEDIPNVRMAVGSNSASMWWLDGKEAVILSGDRRMVQDDCLSPRLTLRKGRNVVTGAVINGPGMSDFCVRFINEDGSPVKNLTISVK